MTEIPTQTDGSGRPPTPNNSWTEEKVKKTLKWKDDFKMRRYLHNQVVASYDRLNQILSIPSILITAITSVSIFATLGIENKVPVIIVVGVLNIIALFLQGVNEFYDPKTLSHKHQNTVKQYAILYNDIDEQLAQDPFDRDNGRDFMKKIRGRSNDLILNGPTIPNRFWDDYFTKMSNGEIITEKNEKLFTPENNVPSQHDSQRPTLHSHDHSGETVIQLSAVNETEPITLQRTYSESSEGSKETHNQMLRFARKNGNQNKIAKLLTYHVGRI